MGINLSFKWENVRVTDAVMTDSYSRNAGLALNADLTLMLRRGAHSLTSVLKRRVAQACV